MTKPLTLLSFVLVAMLGSSCSDLPMIPGKSPSLFPDSITHAYPLPAITRAPDSASRRLGDTLIGTSAFIDRANADAPPTIVSIQASASVGGQPATPLAECPIVLRLFRSGNRGGTPVWRSDLARPELACPSHNTTASSFARFALPTRSVLGDSLPSGYYSFTYTVRTADGRSFDFPNGRYYLDAAPPATISDSGLEYSAKTEIHDGAPLFVRTTVTVRNPGAHAALTQYGGCTLDQDLYKTADRSGAPAWRWIYGRACGAALMNDVINPGDSLVFADDTPMYQILGDSLPDGRYYVSATVHLKHNVRLDAGDVALSRQHDIMPQARVIGDLYYVATTRLVGDTIRTLLLVTNNTTHDVFVPASANCSVIVYGYRSAAERDSVPIVNTQIRLNPPCAIDPFSFILEAGQSWVFGNDYPVASLRASSGAGHYWFTAWYPAVSSGSALFAARDIEIK